MVYEVRVKNPDGSESRFELKRNEAIELGDVITQGTTRYMATRVLPDESDRFDAVVEAQWFAGPVQHLGRSE
jgi:hypothetical protein